MGSMQWNPTFQWFDDRIEQHSAMALVLSGAARMDTIIMHGCRPAGSYHTITKAEGPLVLEIDGKPALDAIADLLGPDSDKSWEDYPLFVTLGVNKGDKFGQFKDENYANRLVMAIDRERRALVMFENDLKQGFEVQLMRRSIDFDYIGRRADELLGRLGGRTPFFALYIDCAARASAYCGTEREEAAEVQRRHRLPDPSARDVRRSRDRQGRRKTCRLSTGRAFSACSASDGLPVADAGGDEHERLRREVEYYRRQVDELGGEILRLDYAVSGAPPRTHAEAAGVRTALRSPAVDRGSHRGRPHL